MSPDKTNQSIVLRKTRSLFLRLRSILLSQRFGFSPSKIYKEQFYEGSGCFQGQRSAGGVVSVLAHAFKPESVFDVGCGSGFYLSEFSKLGVFSCGCDGSEHGVKRCVPNCLVFQHDLRKPLVINRRFDLVLCIEVAEHLPASAADTLIASITGISEKNILFCASPSHMGGDDHINCRPNEYWIEKFKARGFAVDPQQTESIRAACQHIDAPVWLRSWSLAFRCEQ